eukprot:233655-Pleurochrysis_carterae.AAC.1
MPRDRASAEGSLQACAGSCCERGRCFLEVWWHGRRWRRRLARAASNRECALLRCQAWEWLKVAQVAVELVR